MGELQIVCNRSEGRFEVTLSQLLYTFQVPKPELDAGFDHGPLAPVVPRRDLDDGATALQRLFERRPERDPVLIVDVPPALVYLCLCIDICESRKCRGNRV